MQQHTSTTRSRTTVNVADLLVTLHSEGVLPLEARGADARLGAKHGEPHALAATWRSTNRMSRQVLQNLIRKGHQAQRGAGSGRASEGRWCCKRRRETAERNGKGEAARTPRARTAARQGKTRESSNSKGQTKQETYANFASRAANDCSLMRVARAAAAAPQHRTTGPERCVRGRHTSTDKKQAKSRTLRFGRTHAHFGTRSAKNPGTDNYRRKADTELTRAQIQLIPAASAGATPKGTSIQNVEPFPAEERQPMKPPISSVSRLPVHTEARDTDAVRERGGAGEC